MICQTLCFRPTWARVAFAFCALICVQAIEAVKRIIDPTSLHAAWQEFGGVEPVASNNKLLYLCKEHAALERFLSERCLFASCRCCVHVLRSRKISAPSEADAKRFNSLGLELVEVWLSSTVTHG